MNESKTLFESKKDFYLDSYHVKFPEHLIIQQEIYNLENQELTILKFYDPIYFDIPLQFSGIQISLAEEIEYQYLSELMNREIYTHFGEKVYIVTSSDEKNYIIAHELMITRRKNGDEI